MFYCFSEPTFFEPRFLPVVFKVYLFGKREDFARDQRVDFLGRFSSQVLGQDLR